jgi:hypothetical protein
VAPTWPVGAGVDGVLHQLLNDAGRPIDDLAGGDPGNDVRRQPADARHIPRTWPISRTTLPTASASCEFTSAGSIASGFGLASRCRRCAESRNMVANAVPRRSR